MTDFEDRLITSAPLGAGTTPRTPRVWRRPHALAAGYGVGVRRPLTSAAAVVAVAAVVGGVAAARRRAATTRTGDRRGRRATAAG